MSQRVARGVAVLMCVALLAAMPGFAQPAQAAETGTNWTGSYYANPNLQGAPVFTRIDPAVIFNWGPNPPGPGIGSQFWSARWVAIQYMNAGTYRFQVTVDDGVRLYLDGVLILDQWRTQATTTYTVDAQVAAGNHAIQVDYFQAAGDAVISVTWQAVIAPSSSWTAQYFNNPQLAGAPVLTRAEYQINYEWGLGSPDNFTVFPDYFSARWTAVIPFQAATYRFRVAVDDGVRLYIDDALVINQWQIQSLREFVIDVPLAAGLHTIRLEYFEWTERSTIRFSYQVAVGPPIPPVSGEWYGEYFANQDLAGSPMFVRYDGRSGLNFTRDTLPLPPGFQRDYISARWTRVVCEFPGRPTLFYAVVDDGIRLYIDNTLVIDQWRPQPTIIVQQWVDLTAGCHTLRLEYRQEVAQATLFFTWSPPDGQFPPLPISGPGTGVGVQAVVNTGALNVRSGPGINYSILAQVRLGQVIQLSARNADGSWVRGQVQGGLGGWVSARYLRVTSGSISQLPVDPGSSTPGQTGVRGRLTSTLRVRSGPGTFYPEIGMLGYGITADIIGRSQNNLWLQVRYGGITGWVSAPYVIIVSGSLTNVPITG